MRLVCEKNMCTGCMACVDSCPIGAISIIDSINAYNACINDETCISCNLCNKVCHVKHPIEGKTPIKWCQGWAADETIRNLGSSGGLASEFARSFIASGGVVCTCVYKDGMFGFQFIDTEQDVYKIAGSKYVKSNPSGAYAQIRDFLRKNIRVLFIGLPCQVAALKKVIGLKLGEQLTTVDLICHGTPSPNILSIYLQQHGKSIKEIYNIKFREKNTFSVCGQDTKGKNLVPITHKKEMDKYSIAFLNGACYTENCYSCRYAKVERISDVTIGDSWGSELDRSEKNRGISLVLCQTEKGLNLLNSANLKLFDVDLDRAIKSNHQLHSPAEMPRNRNVFLTKLKAGGNFNHLVWQYFTVKCIKQKVKKYLIMFHLVK